MLTHVCLQHACPCKREVTVLALEGRFPGVNLHNVRLQLAWACTRVVTVPALEGLFPSVCVHVRLQVARKVETLATHLTRIPGRLPGRLVCV